MDILKEKQAIAYTQKYGHGDERETLRIIFFQRVT